MIPSPAELRRLPRRVARRAAALPHEGLRLAAEFHAASDAVTLPYFAPE